MAACFASLTARDWSTSWMSRTALPPASVSWLSEVLPLTSTALFQEDASAFTERVTPRSHPDFDARLPAETVPWVTMTHRGDRYVSPVTSPPSDASAARSWPELEDTFLAASRFAALPKQQAQVTDAIWAACAHDFGPLTQALATLRLAAEGAAGAYFATIS